MENFSETFPEYLLYLEISRDFLKSNDRLLPTPQLFASFSKK
ncbi:hypothetical protein [Okeania sp. SIO3I5]|nr:hypothetical protein [Okeania sp. SIO3I5]